ncbi:Dimethylmenaquinone methyltransferase [Hyphomicrobiales bacterium]|nr:Dimethylmenaquinone methyltransferase [Hyphomicrobiales bacterium]CAH1693174.1 Dimethylmenaquinone methyltransferase [Hyphomicrobiales bacterium]
MNDPAIPWPVGFRINARPTRIDDDLIEAFKGVAAAHVSDCLGRIVGTSILRAYHGGGRMCGRALTVRVRPGDNLMIHKALEMAEAGDVLVIDGGGDTSQALLGELMRATAITKGLAGVVIDGAIRDVSAFTDGKLPCFARGHTHRGPSKDGPGEINVPIACAGLAVAPGDLVIGDEDGVVAVNPAGLHDLLAQVRAHAAKEERAMQTILAGKTDPERINAILRNKGVPPSAL